jgi:hypothetical protein
MPYHCHYSHSPTQIQSITPSRSPSSFFPYFPSTSPISHSHSNLNFPLPFLLTHIFVLFSHPTVQPSTIRPVDIQESESASVDPDSDFSGVFAGFGDETAMLPRRGRVGAVRRGHTLSRRGLMGWARKRHGMATLSRRALIGRARGHGVKRVVAVNSSPFKWAGREGREERVRVDMAE